MKAYKGFNPDWTCLEERYNVGETKYLGKTCQLCHVGFHACLNPLMVFSYYPP